MGAPPPEVRSRPTDRRPVPIPPARGPTRLATALARLEGDLDGLAREWLLSTLERRTLGELELLALEPLARELPRLVGGVVAELAGRAGSVETAEWLGRLAAVTGPGEAVGAEVALDVACLQSVLLVALARELADEPTLLAEAVGAVGATFAGFQAPGVEAILAARTAPPPPDPVTGLPSGGALDRDLGALLARHERYARPFALLLLDVDGLGRINAARGRAAGDRALRAVARAAAASVRGVDSLARTEDADVTVLLPEQDAPGAAAAAERIAAAVSAPKWHERRPVTVSIGVAVCPDHGTEAGTLLAAAADALLRARAEGRGVALAPPPGERR